MKKFFTLLVLLTTSCSLWAQSPEEELTSEQYEVYLQLQSDSIVGQTGSVALPSAHSHINVPDGFVFLSPSESRHLLCEYWDNPTEAVEGILGTLVSSEAGIYNNVSTAYVISYDDAGYVSDKDAKDIDYSALLKEMQKDTKEANKKLPPQRRCEFLGWGWEPKYDSNKKVLSWAKRLKFANNPEIINYDIRVLGKAGFITITAVADGTAKDEILAAEPDIINATAFDKGYTYADFNPDTDHVAEWTIGGLIAGKVLAKAGIWALLAKGGKLLIVALIAVGGAVLKFFGSFFKKLLHRKDDDDDFKGYEVDTD